MNSDKQNFLQQQRRHLIKNINEYFDEADLQQIAYDLLGQYINLARYEIIFKLIDHYHQQEDFEELINACEDIYRSIYWRISDAAAITDDALEFIQQNICQIKCQDNDTDLYQYSTGFFIHKNLVFTCYHAVGNRNTETFYDNINIIANHENCTAHVLSALCSAEHDYAILYASAALLSVFSTPKTEKRIDENTEVRSYGFATSAESHVVKLDKLAIKATYEAKEELPSLGHPDVIKLNSREQILAGQSGSPLCVIKNDLPFLIGMLKGDHLIRISEDQYKIEIFGLPVKYIIDSVNSIDYLENSPLSFAKVVRKPDRSFQINRRPIDTTQLSFLLKKPINSINFYEAEAFARILGGRLATEYEWRVAKEQKRIVTGDDYKEWLMSPVAAKNAMPPMIEYSSNRRQIHVVYQRPEAKNSNYVLRIVKDTSLK